MIFKRPFAFILVPPDDSPLKEHQISPKVQMVLAGGLLFVAGLFVYLAYGHFSGLQYRSQLAEARQVNEELTQSIDQTKYLVNQLEEALFVLADDDEKLRHWHQMEPLTAEDRLAGVGGVEDLPADFTALPPRQRIKLEDLNATVLRLQREARLQKESFELITEKVFASENRWNHVPAVSPVPDDRKWPTWLSSGFGSRNDPFTGKPAFHSGIDFAGRKGTPITATAAGVVRYAYEDSRLGKVVVINHDMEELDENGQPYTKKGLYRTEYGHMDELKVKKGQRVERGQVIGTMGSTGRSTGPHLHYSVRYQDPTRRKFKGYLDPMDFLLDKPRETQVAGWLLNEE